LAVNPRILNEAKKRFSFGAWRGVNTLNRNLFIWKFALAGYDIPGWRPVQLRRLALPGTPPHIQSIWRRADAGQQVLLRVDVYECASRLAAHNTLLELLANFETPLARRATQIRIGDVAFAGPPNPWLAFARANLVILFRNAGALPVDVTGTAEKLDDDLTDEPQPQPAAPAPPIRNFAARAKTPKVGARVPIDLNVADTPGTPFWYKIFSEGEVEMRGGKFVYRPLKAKPQDVVLFAMLANRAASARKSLRLNVK
jgi:hypothetical protein